MKKFDIFNRFRDAVIIVNNNKEVIYKNNKFKRCFVDFVDLKKFSHNANFDMLFLLAAALRTNTLKYFQEKDVLDTLTVYKDRAPYPHKLSDAIEKYGLGETVRNSHGADDDTKALVQVLLAMGREKDDLGK